MKFGVVVFYRSNCDKGSIYVPEQISDQQVVKHWSENRQGVFETITRTLHA